MQISVELRRGADNQAVSATLLSLTAKHVEDFAVRWRSPLVQASQEDKYWDWHFKQRLSETRDNYEGYAVECEGDTQGLMALETQMRLAPDPDDVIDADEAPLVYFEYSPRPQSGR